MCAEAVKHDAGVVALGYYHLKSCQRARIKVRNVLFYATCDTYERGSLLDVLGKRSLSRVQKIELIADVRGTVCHKVDENVLLGDLVTSFDLRSHWECAVLSGLELGNPGPMLLCFPLN